MIASLLLAYNPNDVKPGWIAFGLVIALGVATYLLWRSMNTQLRKIQMPPKQRRATGLDSDRPRPGVPGQTEEPRHPADDDRTG